MHNQIDAADEGRKHNSDSITRTEFAFFIFGWTMFFVAGGVGGTAITDALVFRLLSYWPAALIGYPMAFAVIFFYNYMEADSPLELAYISAVFLLMALLLNSATNAAKERNRLEKLNQATNAQRVDACDG